MSASGPWFHFYKVTVGATLQVQSTRVPGIYTPTGQPLPMTGTEVRKPNFFALNWGKCQGVLSTPELPSGSSWGLGLLSCSAPPPPAPHRCPWEHFFNQLLAHKSLAPSGGPAVSPGLEHHSCSVNICCLSEWIHEWMNKLRKSQAGGIQTGYYTNYGLSTFFPSTSVKQVGPLGNFPKAFEVDRVSSHQFPVLPNWASH